MSPQYFSWQPFTKNGCPGKWTKTHIVKNGETLCGLKIPKKLEVFDYSSKGYTGDGCNKCWSSKR